MWKTRVQAGERAKALALHRYGACGCDLLCVPTKEKDIYDKQNIIIYIQEF
jgi:hypothetical protein